MNEIKASDIRAWQNALMKKGYLETYLKTVNNQLSAIFNYAVRYYDLKDNPCRKAGSIGKSHAGEIMDAVPASDSLEDGINSIQEILESNGIVEIITD